MRNPKLVLLICIALGMGGYLYFGEFQTRRAQKSEALRASRLFPEITESDIHAISFVTADGYPVSLERDDAKWRLVAPVSSVADQGVVSALAEALAGLLAQERLAKASAPAVYGLGEDARRIQFSARGKSYGLRLGQVAPVAGGQGGQLYVTRDGLPEVALVTQGALRGFDKLLRDYRPRRVFSLDPARVRRIEISWLREKATLEKQESLWRIVTPVRALADQTAVTALLSQLAELKADDFVDTPSEAQQVSLASPEMILKLKGMSSANTSEFPLRLLVAGSAGGNRLLVQAGKRAPVLVRVSALRTLPQNLSALRDLILSAFPKADAQVVEIDRMSESTGNRVHIRFERNGDDWVEAGGAPSEESSQQIQQLVERLSSLRAHSVVAESVGQAERAALHLDPAFIRVRVFGESGNALADLRISDRSLASGERLLQSGDRPTLYSGEVEIAPFLAR